MQDSWEQRVGRPLLTLNHAAQLMGISEDDIKDMVKKGMIKIVGDVDKGYEPMIQQSVLDEMCHPWHILFRQEERMDAQQRLVETLKTKLNHTADCNTQILRIANDLNRLSVEVDASYNKWWELASRVSILEQPKSKKRFFLVRLWKRILRKGSKATK